MNTKIIGIIIILLGLAGIFGGAFFVYRQLYYKPDEIVIVPVEEKVVQKKEVKDEDTQNLPVKTEYGGVENIIKLQEKKSVTISGKETLEKNESPKDEQLKRTASLFIERLGSYSNQSNFSNVADLKIYMSNKMRRWADDFIEKNNIDRDVSIYYGITTKSISQKIESINIDDGRAVISVNTLRRESGGDLSEDNSFYQSAKIHFILENGFWKVDSANWE